MPTPSDEDCTLPHPCTACGLCPAFALLSARMAMPASLSPSPIVALVWRELVLRARGCGFYENELERLALRTGIRQIELLGE